MTGSVSCPIRLYSHCAQSYQIRHLEDSIEDAVVPDKATQSASSGEEESDSTDSSEEAGLSQDKGKGKEKVEERMCTRLRSACGMLTAVFCSTDAGGRLSDHDRSRYPECGIS
jgi:hypothetical protein